MDIEENDFKERYSSFIIYFSFILFSFSPLYPRAINFSLYLDDVDDKFQPGEGKLMQAIS